MRLKLLIIIMKWKWKIEIVVVVILIIIIIMRTRKGMLMDMLFIDFKINLLQKKEIPDDCDILAIAGPTAAMTAEEVEQLLSEAEGKALRRFVDGGGKLITFYVLPPPLPELLGVRKVKWQRRERDGQFLDLDLRGLAAPGEPAESPLRVEVRELTLMRSILRPEGPIYTPLFRVPLGKS